VRMDPALFVVAPVFILSVVAHECAHALAALACGDPTARDRGRVTLNPLPHLDLVGSILLPGALALLHSPVLFGWAKPVPLNGANLRDPRNDAVKIALAGPLANLLLAVTFAAVARAAPPAGFFSPLRDMGLAGVVMNCALALFNLIPIPPLDGAWVVMRFIRLRHILVLHQFRLVGLLVVAGLASWPVTSQVVLIAPLRFAVRAALGLFGMPGGGVLQ
jgi:Zn-dependent protease